MNNYKVLIVEDEKPTREAIVSVITKAFNFESIEAGDGEEALSIIKKDLPNLIFLDLNIPKINGYRLIEILKEDMATIDIPIIIISAEESETIKEKLELHDIKYILSKPMQAKQLIKTIKIVLNNENRFTGSYTNRFIKSFLSYYLTGNIAFEMISILEVLSREILISNQKKLDMQASLAMLSTTLKSNKTAKAIQLFEDMRFANDILKFLRGFETHKSLYEQIIYLIYNFKKVQFEGKSFDIVDVKGINYKILKLVRGIVDENIVIVKSKYGFNLVFNKLIDILINLLNIDTKLVNEFLSYSKAFLREIIIQNGESMIKIIDTEANLKFLISDNRISINKLKDYIKDIKSPYININAEIIDDEKVIVIYLNKDLKEKKVKKEAVVSSDSYEQQLLQKSVLDEVISANEYLENLDIDISEDLYDLDEIERIWESKVILLETSKDEELFQELSKVIKAYGDKINNVFYEFKALGYAFSSLSEVIQTEKVFDLSSIENIAIFLENLLHDITKWRETIFVEASAENIHYLDNSLLSSCMQVESMIKNEEIGGDDEIEFF